MSRASTRPLLLPLACASCAASSAEAAASSRSPRARAIRASVSARWVIRNGSPSRSSWTRAARAWRSASREVVDREIRQGQLVLGQPDLGPGVDRPEQGHALDPGPDRTLVVARHPVGLGQRVEQGGATAVVEVRTERACLLEEGDRGARLTPVRHDRREGDQDADPQLRVRLGSDAGRAAPRRAFGHEQGRRSAWWPAASQ